MPLPLYVGAFGLTGLCTGMGYNLGQLAIQNVLPPERSAEGTGVMLTLLLLAGLLLVVGLLRAARQRTSGQPAARPQPR